MRWAALALIVATACAPAATSAPVSSPAATTSPPRPATPTPVSVNVDDMMGGGIPDATVFTLVGGEIHAVVLLNHFVRYRIAVSGRPHAVVSADGARLYVADRKGGRTRVRAFDVVSGTEVGATSVAEEPADDAALAMDRSDRLLLLVKAGTGVRVEAVRTSPLAAIGGTAKAPCGERLLASESRIAVVCASGTVGLNTLVGSAPYLTVTGGPIVAATMLRDGTVVLGTASGGLYRIPSGRTDLVEAAQLGPGAILADGIAPAERGFVVFTGSGDGATATVYEPYAGIRVAGPFALSLRGPRIAALGPYAYFAGERGLWHVDLRNGLLERMLTLDGPVPLAVSTR